MKNSSISVAAGRIKDQF